VIAPGPSPDTVDALRTPPHSIEAEQSVLGGLLIDNRSWDRVGDLLTDRDFYRVEHRLIYSAVATLAGAGQPADVITVFETLQRLGKADDVGGLKYLNSLAQSVPSATNMRRYGEIVRECAVMRAVINATGEASTLAWAGDDAGATLDRITTLFGALQRQQVQKLPRSIAEIALERIDHYTALEEGTATSGWPTHIEVLDARLNGGLRAGSLYILAARPSVGKSSFAQNIGLALASDGLPTLMLSLEMTEDEVADRGVANLGKVSYSALLTGTRNHEKWTRASEAIDRFSRLPFFVDDQAALTLRDIRTKAKSVKGLKVLILDYLQLCASTRRDGNRNSEIEEISRGLKALAKELGIAVIALSQLNRDVEKRAVKCPNLADLRDSGAIEQDADVVMFLWPVREFETEGRRIVGLGIGKNRQGRLGEVGLDFYGDTQSWSESTADIRPQPQGRPHQGDL
jgi:replicative DNA helicase